MEFEELLNRRYACKNYANTKVSKERLERVLDAGRRAPSSFGMEGWRFLVIKDPSLRQSIKAASWDQAQITEASELIVILAAIKQLKPSSGVPEKRLERRGLVGEALKGYVDRYSSFFHERFGSDEQIYAWSARQCYIALAHMMLSAASMDLDCCAIEGFEKEQVERILEIDTNRWQVAVMMTLGIAKENMKNEQRLKFDDVVEIRE